jgi:hypothetical protein
MVAVGGWMEERQGGLEQSLLLHQLQTLGEPLLTSIRGKKYKRVAEYSMVTRRRPESMKRVAVGGWMEERQGGLEEPLLFYQLQTLGEPLLTSIRGKTNMKQGSQNMVWSPEEDQNLTKW